MHMHHSCLGLGKSFFAHNHMGSKLNLKTVTYAGLPTKVLDISSCVTDKSKYAVHTATDSHREAGVESHEQI